MAMRVKKVAKLAGISVRTLHHYDEIGLLVPNEVTTAGYRLYSEDDLARLQQILFFRELDFPLKQIQEILSSPSFDRVEALELQQNMLREKRRRLDVMMDTIEKTLKSTRGEITMTASEQFKGFDFGSNPYEEEARKRWGDEAVDGANAKVKGMAAAEKQAMSDRMNTIYFRLAALRDGAPDSAEAQEAIGDWYVFLNSMGSHSYTLEAFKGLGQMYVDDERFTRNIDQFGAGLAVFMRDAMEVYVDRREDVRENN
ncbi:MerR family transcriptional regulator [Paenibacillus massiliensis]|uniref:MerR family transcriptional regulator n=1 Tax=Paenibacillus massiliensis TaxID=225917 RepID=UPI0004702294|nr:MerR family transcriptional regulator [Paenibacillus massiliensis]